MRESARWLKNRPDCHANDAAENAKDAAEVDKVHADLNNIDACIAAMRLAFRDLSGEEPKECKESK